KSVFNAISPRADFSKHRRPLTFCSGHSIIGRQGPYRRTIRQAIMNEAKVMVVIPTYNEADNLPTMSAELLTLGIQDLEILFVDDTSPDGTGQVAERLTEQYPGRIHVLHRPGKLGLGTAYLTGFRYALD